MGLDDIPTSRYVLSVPAPSAKQKLLDASLSLFRERGFAATTVDDLCHRAGVTKGAFSTWSLTLQGFYQASLTSPAARMTHIVGDGRPYVFWTRPRPAG